MKDSGALAPLLPEVQRKQCKGEEEEEEEEEEEKIWWSGHGDGGASVGGAVFNVSTSIVGAGIMSIPATLKVLGVVPALGLIMIVAVLSDVSVDFLLRYSYSSSSNNKSKMSYAGVMGESFGEVGSVVLQVCVMVTTLGSLVIYLIIIGDVLSGSEDTDGTLHLGILQDCFGIHWWNSRAFTLLFAIIFVMLPLVLLRRVDSLRFTSAISILLALVFVLISSFMALSALYQGKTTTTPRLFPPHPSSFLELFTAVPVIVTAFTFHFNVHPIAAELSKPSQMVSAVRVSLVLCAAIYCAVGFFGYLLFGDSTMADILANFDQNFSSTSIGGSLLNNTVRLSYALHLILVFPLLNFSLRLNIDALLFPNSSSSTTTTTTQHPLRFISLTCFLLAFIYLVAIAIPNIWYFFQLVGSTTAVCIAFVFPGAIVLRDVHGISTRRDTILASVMILLAVIASSIAISSNIITLIRPSNL